MSFNFKYHLSIFIFFSFFILNACQLQEQSINHGIIFLKNRADKLEINVTNTNDVVKLIGQPHSKSIDDDKEWIYIERIFTKGEYHKLGKNILKTNNVLILNFNKYGVLTKKNILNIKNKNKLAFSKKETKNQLTKKSFVEKILTSIKQKMYSNKN